MGQGDILRQGDAGLIPDWNIGLNARHCEWVENRHWVYRAALPDDWFKTGRLFRLRCLGLDYCGLIRLNGADVAPASCAPRGEAAVSSPGSTSATPAGFDAGGPARGGEGGRAGAAKSDVWRLIPVIFPLSKRLGKHVKKENVLYDLILKIFEVGYFFQIYVRTLQHP